MNKDDLFFDGIENLLDLNDFAAEVGAGYWVCMKVTKVNPDEGRPHGLNYALTLHTPSDGRLVGYDNAHAPTVGSGPSMRSKRQRVHWDHRHWRDTMYVYDFRSAHQLLMDFWDDVERMLKEEGQS